MRGLLVIRLCTGDEKVGLGYLLDGLLLLFASTRSSFFKVVRIVLARK